MRSKDDDKYDRLANEVSGKLCVLLVLSSPVRHVPTGQDPTCRMVCNVGCVAWLVHRSIVCGVSCAGCVWCILCMLCEVYLVAKVG